jgi:hypothetical protein
MAAINTGFRKARRCVRSQLHENKHSRTNPISPDLTPTHRPSHRHTRAKHPLSAYSLEETRFINFPTHPSMQVSRRPRAHAREAFTRFFGLETEDGKGWIAGTGLEEEEEEGSFRTV